MEDGTAPLLALAAARSRSPHIRCAIKRAVGPEHYSAKRHKPVVAIKKCVKGIQNPVPVGAFQLKNRSRATQVAGCSV